LASEEQKKDLQMKITIAVVVIIIGAAIYSISTPGLERLRQKAMASPTEPWAPEWMYKIARVYEATWRKDKALETYKDFYYLYSGDERRLEGIQVTIDESQFGGASYSLIPRWENMNRTWVGGEGAQPHPLMADVLLQMCKICEDDRNYPEARFYYMNVLNCFPAGTEVYNRAKEAEKRDKGRAF
jgi:hypothetical protein